MAQVIDPQEPFFRFLDTVGDGTGTINGNLDYSGAAADLKYIAPGPGVNVARMIITVEDATGMRAERYGSLGAALTNGIKLIHLNVDGTDRHDLTNGLPIKTNAQWGAYCYDVELKEWGAGNEFLLVRWTFEKAGSGIHLHPNEALAVRLNDDLRGLVNHNFQIQGERLMEAEVHYR